MDQLQRRSYAEYLAEGIQYANKNSGKDLPEGAVIICQNYSPLVEIDEIMGIPIMKMDINTSEEFTIAVPSDENIGTFLNYFKEYLAMYDLEEGERR